MEPSVSVASRTRASALEQPGRRVTIDSPATAARADTSPRPARYKSKEPAKNKRGRPKKTSNQSTSTRSQPSSSTSTAGSLADADFSDTENNISNHDDNDNGNPQDNANDTFESHSVMNDSASGNSAAPRTASALAVPITTSPDPNLESTSDNPSRMTSGRLFATATAMPAACNGMSNLLRRPVDTTGADTAITEQRVLELISRVLPSILSRTVQQTEPVLPVVQMPNRQTYQSPPITTNGPMHAPPTTAYVYDELYDSMPPRSAQPQVTATPQVAAQQSFSVHDQYRRPGASASTVQTVLGYCAQSNLRFSGSPDEDVQSFLSEVTNVIDSFGLSPLEATAVLKVILKDRARAFYDDLASRIPSIRWSDLSRQLLNRFLNRDVRAMRLDNLRALRQFADEPMDVFYARFLASARLAGKSVDHDLEDLQGLLRRAVKPDLRDCLSMASCTTLDELAACAIRVDNGRRLDQPATQPPKRYDDALNVS
jgi:hypothetical protein